MKCVSELTLLVVFAFCCIANAEKIALSSTPMLDCSGLPCVDVVLASGKHLRLLVDTGNVNSLIDAAKAKEMGLMVAPVNGADGKPLEGYGLTALQGIKFGQASLGDLKVLVMDLGAHIKRDRFPATDGTLAYTAFKDRILELDYKHREVGISERLTAPVPCPGFCGTITTPTFGKQGPPIVVATGFSINGQPATAQIDTAFSGSMLVYPTAIDKLGLTALAQTTHKRFFKFTDDGVDMLEAKVNTEGFGKTTLAHDSTIYFATAAVHQPDGMFDATVGQELFQNFVVTLDFHDKQMWMVE